MTRRSRAPVAAVVAAVAGVGVSAAVAACSLALDFEDECGGGQACGAGYVCVDDKYCVPGNGGRVSLTTDLCPTLYGATEAEVEAGHAILLGALSPNSGELAATGPAVERAIFLAVDELNQLGGIDTRKIAVLACDDGTGGNEKGVNAATHLVEVAHVPAIIGPGASSNTLEIFNKVTKDADVLLISPSATSPALSELSDNDLVWRTPPSDDLQGNAIAALITHPDDLGLWPAEPKVAVINRNDTYGVSFRKVIEGKLCGDAPCADTRYITRAYDTDAPRADQSRAIVELEAFQPDVIVLIAFLEDGVEFVNSAARSTRATLKHFILTDGMKEPPVVEIEDATVRSTLVGTAPASPSNLNYYAFETSYKARWRGSPPAVFNAQAYDALYLLALAIGGAGRDAELTGPVIARQLKRMSAGNAKIAVGQDDFQRGINTLRSSSSATIDFAGASGPLDFDAHGEAPADIELWHIEDGAVGSMGVVYTADGRYVPPTAPSTPPSGG